MARSKRKRAGRKASSSPQHVAQSLRPPKKPLLALIVAAVAIGALLLSPPGRDVVGLGGGPPTLTAAIVDQLGATYPSPAFAEAATDTLEQAGYDVDYYPPEEVTVEFYRDLPRGDYDLIVLRNHSTAEITRGEEDVRSVSLFTNEPYSRDRYYAEQLEGRIGFAQYSEHGPQYFGITAEFIESSMEGRFDGTTIVMMGCQGLLNDLAAEAFARKGAGDYISWDGLVSADHTDTATLSLLHHLTVDNMPTDEAVATTMDDVGPDPSHGSQLLLYRPG